MTHEFNARAPITDGDAARSLAERFASAAGISERIELRLVDGALLVGGPDGFGFFGTTSFRWVRVPLPTTARAVALALARHIVGEYWATDDEIAQEHARLPLAMAMALT